MKEIKMDMIAEFDEAKPSQSAILTQGICDIINKRKDKLIVGKAVFIVLSQFPHSSYSKKKSKTLQYLKNIPNEPIYDAFREICKGKELEVEIIFFLAENFDSRDVDNLIKIVIDSFVGKWYDDDSQIKRIIAEKEQVPDMEDGVNPKLYEQIYFSARIID